MKYFYDTEFLEGAQKRLFGKTEPTIDLISIGIVCEDGREFYAVSKDFNLKEAWNRYDLKHEQTYGDMRNKFPNGVTKKVYWIRENVLKPIYYDWVGKDVYFHKIEHFTYKNFKRLLKKYGRTNKQIAQEVKNFCYSDKETRDGGGQFVSGSFIPNKYPNIDLYGYYSSYDHVALCWLFGKMVELPKGFPMYTIDLKQEMDRLYEVKKREYYLDKKEIGGSFISKMSLHPDYPKQTNEHNALSDARFNYELYKFLESI